jgi:predicted amidohydrolase YtcJ
VSVDSNQSILQALSGPEVATSGVNHDGILLHKTDVLADMIAKAKSKGFRVEAHAIGDAAVEQVSYID